MKKRRGVSLVELLLLMTACALILTLSAQVIHRSMLAHTKAKRFYDGERSAQRLANQFRSDVHEATAATVGQTEDGDSPLVQLTMADDRSVEYHHTGDSLERRVLSDAEVKSRERFDFPSKIEVAVAEDAEDKQTGRQRIALTITSRVEQPVLGDARPKSAAYAMPTRLEVRAIVGRTAAALARLAEERSPE